MANECKTLQWTAKKGRVRAQVSQEVGEGRWRTRKRRAGNWRPPLALKTRMTRTFAGHFLPYVQSFPLASWRGFHSIIHLFFDHFPRQLGGHDVVRRRRNSPSVGGKQEKRKSGKERDLVR